MSKAITVKEIARRAGVSPATVSRVLNGGHGVGSGKCEAVKNAVQEISPELLPGLRKQQRGKTIGMLLFPQSDKEPRVILEKLTGTLKVLPEKWNLLLLSPEIMPLELESKYLKGEIAGLLLMGHRLKTEGFEKILSGIPHVWMNSHDLGQGKSNVMMGNEFAGRLAARYLMRRSCRNPLWLQIAPSMNPGFPSRTDGFRFEFFAAGKSCRSCVLTPPKELRFWEEASDEQLEQLFAEQLADPSSTLSTADGIFSPEERLTAILHRSLRKYGGRKIRKKWPDIISCNHVPEYLTGLYPRPASIDLGPRSVAKLGMEELLRRISGLPPGGDRISVITTPELIQGD